MCGSLQRRVLNGFGGCACLQLHAGGSGLNTVSSSTRPVPTPCELGNYYCQERPGAASNVLSINWSGAIPFGPAMISNQSGGALLNMLATQQLTNQIDTLSSRWISFKPASVPPQQHNRGLVLRSKAGQRQRSFWITNSYAASEAVFRQAPPVGAPAILPGHDDHGASLAQAEQLVDQGVASDGTFPNNRWSWQRFRHLSQCTVRAFRQRHFNVNILAFLDFAHKHSGLVANGCRVSSGFGAIQRPARPVRSRCRRGQSDFLRWHHFREQQPDQPAGIYQWRGDGQLWHCGRTGQRYAEVSQSPGLLLPGPRLQSGRELFSKRQRAVSRTHGGRAAGGALRPAGYGQWGTNLPNAV